MGLQKTIVLNSGITVENAYIRIDTINGFKKEITISVNKYISRDAFYSGCPYLEQTEFYKFTPNTLIDAKEIFTQGYDYLKSTNYSQAIDVLENI
jgi:coenzyme F420-reducing hydrogenase gamma subunit